MPTCWSSATARARRESPSGSTSVICRSTLSTGLSAVIGSWKTMTMPRPRTRSSSRSGSGTRSRPWKTTRPPVIRPGGWTRRTIARQVIVLPEPDSPTRAMVSPARTPKLPPRTAWTTTRRLGISTRRSSTASSPTPSVIRSLPLHAEQVGNPVAEEDEGEAGVHAGEVGHRRHPPPARQELAPLRDHHLPLGSGRPDAQPQEAERRRREDDQHDIGGEEDDRGRNGVGEDVSEDEPAAPEPEGP